MNGKLVPLVVLLLAGGCGPEEHSRYEINDVRRLKVGAPMARAATSADRFGLRQQAEVPTADAAPAFAYDLPDGWVELGPAQFRDVNLEVPGGVACWVSSLAGLAGGALDNLNRWRAQFGLPPATADELAALPTWPLLGAKARFVDLTRPGSGDRFIGLMSVSSEGSVFVRMTGPGDRVEAELASFRAFAESLRRAPKTSANPGSTRGGLTWTAPEDWRELRPTQFKIANYDVGDDAKCWVSVLQGDGGGLALNVQRWHGQVGLPPPTPDEIESLPELQMLGRAARLVELSGAEIGMLGVMCELENRCVFVKLVGPVAAVRARKDSFVAFCKTLEAS